VSPPSPSTHCFTLSLHDALPICEDCPDVTALHAMSAIVARRPVVVGRGQQGAPRGYHRDAHPGAGALDDLLGASKLERRKEFSIRKYFQVFPGSANSNHLLNVGVIRRHFLITDRPVFFNSFHASFAEITFGKPEAVGIPMDAAATHTSNPVNANPVAVLV